MTTKAEIGKRGENLVADHLRSIGALVLERNWRSGRYEIDIIALKDEYLLFVEVKTRAVSDWASPEDAIDASKCRALKRAALAYMAQSPYRNAEFRFDLAAVELNPDGSHELRYTESFLEYHW